MHRSLTIGYGDVENACPRADLARDGGARSVPPKEKDPLGVLVLGVTSTWDAGDRVVVVVTYTRME